MKEKSTKAPLKHLIIITLLGFSSGLPIMVVYGSLKLWLKRYEVDLSTLGFISWIAIPYSWNFLWSFLFDRFVPVKFLGKRRSWLLVTQLALAASFVMLSFGDPSTDVNYIIVTGILLCFFSASQDVAVDAYRNDILKKSELGLGSALGVYGYRVAMWVASGFGIWAVDKENLNWSFNQMFLFLALCMGVGMIATFFAQEPTSHKKQSRSFYETVVLPFFEFLKRKNSLLLLLFILFFKLGDSFAGSMSRPFYADLGFSNGDIGGIVGTVGLFSSMLGLAVGGWLLFKKNYKTTLWAAAILQAISTGLFACLPFAASKFNLGCVVFFEDVTSGIGTTALVAFMGSLVNKQFTATQYALFASLASMGRTMLSGFAGEVIEFFQKQGFFFKDFAQTGYVNFYLLGMLLAIPGMLLLFILGNIDDYTKDL